MPWAQVEPVIDLKMPGLCRHPYPNHPKGCPNWAKKEGCPPSAVPIGKLIDLNREVWAIWNKFDLGSHVSKMREKHPEWTDRQLKCCLYWQPRARIALLSEVSRFDVEHWGYRFVRCPEASGVVLTPTMRQAGIELEWPPEKWAFQIILAGFPV